MVMCMLLYLQWLTSKDLLYSRELCSLLCVSLDWRGMGESRYIYMYC